MTLNKGYIQIGFSKASISPQSPLELCGYGYYLGRVSNGISDVIYSRALYLKLRNTKNLLISCDVLGISEDLYRKISKEISKELGIPTGNIFLCATHTHSAPVVRIISGCGERDEKYMKYFTRKVIENAVNASRKIYDSEVKMKKLNIGGFSFNRASVEKYGVNQDMMMLAFKADDKKILLIQFSTHATILSNKFTKVSKDYVVAFEALAKKLDYDDYIFFNGACGNILPVIVKKNLSTNSTGDTYISSRKFKDELSRFNKIILKQYKSNDWRSVDIDKMVTKRLKIKIPYEIPPFYKNRTKMQKYFEGAFYDKVDMEKGLVQFIPERNSRGIIDKKKRIKGIQTLIKKKYNELQKKLNEGEIRKYLYTYISVIKLGRIRILTYPFELPLEFGKEIRSLYPDLFIFCYSNGLKGYICLPNKNSCYAKKRGSLLYNLFPFRRDSYETLIKETKKLLEI